VPIAFAETGLLAQEWTYRFLRAALAHHDDRTRVLFADQVVGRHVGRS